MHFFFFGIMFAFLSVIDWNRYVVSHDTMDLFICIMSIIAVIAEIAVGILEMRTAGAKHRGTQNTNDERSED